MLVALPKIWARCPICGRLKPHTQICICWTMSPDGRVVKTEEDTNGKTEKKA